MLENGPKCSIHRSLPGTAPGSASAGRRLSTQRYEPFSCGSHQAGRLRASRLLRLLSALIPPFDTLVELELELEVVPVATGEGGDGREGVSIEWSGIEAGDDTSAAPPSGTAAVVFTGGFSARTCSCDLRDDGDLQSGWNRRYPHALSNHKKTQTCRHELCDWRDKIRHTR